MKLPNEDLGAEMYQYLMKTLNQTDFKQYEISNFAKTNHESDHNKVYWFNEEYYGLEQVQVDMLKVNAIQI